MANKLVELQAFLDRDNDHEFKGRCLGLITEAEYAALFSKPGLLKKLWTSETKPLRDVADADEIEGKRLVMTVVEREDEIVTKPMLFITEPLDLISSVVSSKNLNINGKDQSFYIIEEVQNYDGHS